MNTPRPFLARFAKEPPLENPPDSKDRGDASGSLPATRLSTIFTKVSGETTDDN